MTSAPKDGTKLPIRDPLQTDRVLVLAIEWPATSRQYVGVLSSTSTIVRVVFGPGQFAFHVPVVDLTSLKCRIRLAITAKT